MVSCGQAWPPNGCRSPTGSYGDCWSAIGRKDRLGWFRANVAGQPTTAYRPIVKLRERYGLTLSKETIRRLMTVAGLWVPRKQRPQKVYQPRNRRACLGELIQIDGCDHRWFEDRAPACTLLVYVDDATSRIMELRFTHSEATFTYFAATRAYLERHGKPVAFYSDKASVFRVNKQGATSGDGHTQFARALFELNIDGICANSSQAKGRVERTHLTLQDRLVKELRLRGISTMEAANVFMSEFIADYNARFAKVPRNNHNSHRPLRPDENLDLIFAWREPRCVSKSLTIQYDKMLYLLADTPERRKLASRYIDVYHYPDGRIEPRANGAALPYTTYDRLSEVDQGEIVDNKRLGHVLQLAQYVQEKRDNTRSLSVPGTEGAPRKRGRPPGKKSQRSLGQNDMLKALQRLQEQPWPLNGTEY
ncbi:transposase, ISNCY family [Cupriavidus taiwanensis]|uniref:Transposase n=1 Tax=Cupriavidus taiwanensis TaxID=164546 RepID=A0A375FFR6_9BURK|nr:transposase, ISNCY family [Cupriavidus taiwanensis]SOZ73924.1 transposase, ISNCY family [Cupriavidus taiwanensis]SOZ75401.1 transposase, ISNCY family [Cupriavidus taiwanensis]SPA03911.1 transposase, ISNCY family [Cupriavidus taiwanensis]SPA12885.1 transposase, ISNCY family [Cupriavidus taiwanensis]